jgi:Tfp pilus assembly protein PilZ
MTPPGGRVPEDRSVLVLDDAGGERAELVARLRRLGFRASACKTADEVRDRLGDPRHRIGALILPPAVPVIDLAAALADWRARVSAGRLGCVIEGERPDAETLRRLAEAGIGLALWRPWPEAALRFQVNQALDDGPHVRQRQAPRAPLARQVRVLSRAWVRPATLYSLSAGGAFVETQRPAPPGAELELEISLPECDVTAAAQVVYANVPGNLRRASLPLGMGVRFTRVGAPALRAIERSVAAASLGLAVAEPRTARAEADRGWLRRFVRARGD